MKKLYVFITVREQSSRLNQKCFKPFGPKNSVLEWVCARVNATDCLIPVICTGESGRNQNVINFAAENNIEYFSGPEDNKIKRWNECANHLNVDTFHALDCDDPFFDPHRIIESMNLLEDSSVEVVLPSDYSDGGAATEGFSIRAKSLNFSSQLEDTANTEMCYSFFKNKLHSIKLPDPLYAIEKVRLTLDYQEDYNFLNKLAFTLDLRISRELVEEYLSENYEETPNFSINSLWKDNQHQLTEETYENFSRAKQVL
jgi:spore coat polysaccharide biosynthesis protein SpsF (cytidylyltransferase family)